MASRSLAAAHQNDTAYTAYKGRSAWSTPEASLDDLMDDPLTHVIMRHDGVSRESLMALIQDQRQALFGGAESAAAE